MGVDEPDAPEAFAAETVLRKVGDKDITVRAHEHVPDAAGTVDDQAHLPPDFSRGFGQGAGRFGRDDHGRRRLPAVEAFEGLYLGRLEAGYVAMDRGDGGLLVPERESIKGLKKTE